MKKLTLALIFLFASVALLGIFLFSRANNSRQSVVVHIRGDLTSSGGDRTVAADFSFINGQLVAGSASTTMTEGAQNERRDVTYRCVFQNAKWVDDKGNVCTSPLYQLPLSLQEFDKQKRNETVKPAGADCKHLDVCYTENGA